MQALKNPSFFRPSSRPSSPAPPSRPDSGIGLDRSGPLHRLSLSTFRRPSSAPSSAPSTPIVPLIQDGSYLEALSLKLSEAVSKALVQPAGPAGPGEQVAGKRPIPGGRGRALGALIASELKAASDNPHLYRAVIRSLHRPLSVLLSNLSGLLLPLLSSPAFTAPAPTVQAPNPTPTQLHAVAIATLAGEVLETLDVFNLGNESDIRGDGLKVIREGLVSVINRVLSPLIAGIKAELVSLLESLETPTPGIKAATGVKLAAPLHPSIIALQAMIPVHTRALTRYATSTHAQSMLTPFLLSIIWRASVALSNRAHTLNTLPTSPNLTVSVAESKGRGPPTTPPITPPSSRFTIKLPSPASRPPSPPLAGTSHSDDARALYGILSVLPRPDAGSVSTQPAREAIDVAFEGFHSLASLFDAVHTLSSRLKADQKEQLVDELETFTEKIPTLIALPIILRALGHTAPSINSVLGLSEAEYRAGCLSGFGRADEWAASVGQRVLTAIPDDHEASFVVKGWLVREIEL